MPVAAVFECHQPQEDLAALLTADDHSPVFGQSQMAALL